MSVLPVPPLVQSTDYNCGTTAIAMLARYDGVTVPRILKNLANPVTGTSAEVVTAAIHSLYDGKVLSGTMTVDLLKALTKQGRPVLCLITAPEAGGHWVVATGVVRGRVRVCCPTFGEQSHPVAAFEAMWQVSDPAGGWRLDRFGVTAFPA